MPINKPVTHHQKESKQQNENQKENNHKVKHQEEEVHQQQEISHNDNKKQKSPVDKLLKIATSNFDVKDVLLIQCPSEKLYQRAFNLQEGTHILTFDFSAFKYGSQTSTLSIIWNGKQIAKISPSDKNIRNLKFYVEAITGINILSFVPFGDKDKPKEIMLVNNVFVFQKKALENVAQANKGN